MGSQRLLQGMNLNVADLFPPPPCFSSYDDRYLNNHISTTGLWHGQMDVDTLGWSRGPPGTSHLIAGKPRQNGRPRGTDTSPPLLPSATVESQGEQVEMQTLPGTFLTSELLDKEFPSLEKSHVLSKEFILRMRVWGWRETNLLTAQAPGCPCLCNKLGLTHSRTLRSQPSLTTSAQGP
jgi:hypothetical protein